MIRETTTDLILGYQTHPGEKGKNNEDRATVVSYKPAPGERGNTVLAIVADGIGGKRSGEVASQIAIDAISAVFDQADSTSYLDLVTRGFLNTSRGIARQVTSNPEHEGMGTTCVAVVIANRRLYTAYIGDSRIYLLRDGGIRQLTVDHTWVQKAIEHGILTPDEARKHPNRHVVLRYLSTSSDPTPDFRLKLSEAESAEDSSRNQGLPLKTGDVILLCSDGLTDLVDDDEILAAFQQQATPQAAVDALTLMARYRGGFDNITIVAFKVPHHTGPLPRMATGPVGGGVSNTALMLGVLGGFGALAVAVIALAAGLIFFNPLRTPTPTLTNTRTATVGATTGVTNTIAPTLRPATLLPDTPTVLPPTPTLTVPPTVPTNTPTPTVDLTLVSPTATATVVPSETPTTQAP
ncbi:MAG: serine/threonine-protein phosphatase [Chloroflexi bacterium]|nr:serine/threonine-protein phosphatase [Chloroflexota bacterium]